MKILFDHPAPFFLAHGGFQIQIEQTKSALEAIGLEVDWVRWWDCGQSGEVLHFFGRPHAHYIEQAQQKGMKVVMTDLLGGLGVRSAAARWGQRALMTLSRRLLPATFTARLAWDAFTKCDACVALTPWEAQLMAEMFSAPPERLHVVPNGVETVFLEGAANSQQTRGPWLVCAGTITEVKRVLELAHAAVAAKTPVWFVGRPFDESREYVQCFLKLAKDNAEFVRYEGPIQDRTRMAAVYRAARGFVLLSRWETLSIAALEAAACGCPLLLSDLPWARSVFAEHARYCPITSPAQTADVLRKFYEQAPGLSPPPRPGSWIDVARQLEKIYRRAVDPVRC